MTTTGSATYSGDNVNRWYAPGTGRYERRDPLGLGGGDNPYRYAKSNPVNYRDPLGLVSSPADCSCCSDQETTRQFTQITNYIRANSERYRISSHIFGRGCGGAADQMQGDVETNLKPSCWVTESQLRVRATGLNMLAYQLFGVPASVHRVLKLTPCSPNAVFNQDIQVDPYIGIGSVGPVSVSPLPESRQIDDLFDPAPWCK